MSEASDLIERLEKETGQRIDDNEGDNNAEASDLIERLEKETGQRIDDNEGDNNAITGLLGAMSRLMGQSPANYTEHDDVAAGLCIKHWISPEYVSEQASKQMIAEMLAGGMSHDDVKALLG